MKGFWVLVLVGVVLMFASGYGFGYQARGSEMTDMWKEICRSRHCDSGLPTAMSGDVCLCVAGMAQ